MQFLENIDIKSQKDVVSHLGEQGARRHTGIDNAANVSPTDKTLVHSFRVSRGVRPLTCCWQLTNSRVSLGRPRAPHKHARWHFLSQTMCQLLATQKESGCE